MIVFGTNAVLEALRSHPERVRWIALRKGHSGKRDSIPDEARAAGIAIRWSDAKTLDRLVPRGAVHNGAVAEVAAIELADLDAHLENERTQLIIVLDEVTDEGNVGAILRSGDALGADLVVVPERRGAALSPVVVRASAGAANWIPVAQVSNIAKSLEQMKSAGFWVYGAASEGEAIDGVDFAEKTAIVLGSEGKGLRPNVRKHCDVLVSIPMSGHVDSLNVSAATSVLLWEIARQRRARS